jgi:hypothetical protein
VNLAGGTPPKPCVPTFATAIARTTSATSSQEDPDNPNKPSVSQDKDGSAGENKKQGGAHRVKQPRGG